MKFILTSVAVIGTLILISFSLLLDNLNFTRDFRENAETADVPAAAPAAPKTLPEFHGPVGNPYVIGPSGPPPNY